MKKNILTLVLAVTTVAMIAGCGKAQETASGNAEETAQTQETTGDNADGAEQEPEIADGNGNAAGAAQTQEPECAHEWVEATYAAPKTCKLCGDTEGEPKQSYFDEHGVSVPDGPVNCIVDYIYYNLNDPETYCRVGDAVYTQTDCYAEPVDEEGYQNVYLTLTLALQPGCYYDAAENIEYLNFTASGVGVYDWYTGRKLPARSTSDDDAQEYAVTLDIDGVSYEVSYSMQISWEQGNWVYDETRNGTSSMTGTFQYVFRIPEGYDGLVCSVCPWREYEEPDTETVSGLDEAEYADLDPTDEETEEDKKIVEDTRYFRINRTEIPVREAEAGTEDET